MRITTHPAILFVGIGTTERIAVILPDHAAGVKVVGRELTLRSARKIARGVEQVENKNK